jgi:D-isomer specific 2-hydroxyacid dehydrogenase, catalytic domain
MGKQMKVVMFSTQGIETAFLENHPDIFASVEVAHVGKRLTPDTVELARGASAICAFVNDVLDRGVLETLNNFGISLILMRCAGYNVRQRCPPYGPDFGPPQVHFRLCRSVPRLWPPQNH